MSAYNPFSLISSIYTKTKIEAPIDVSTCLFLNKWLALDKSIVHIIKSLIPYVFYIDPLHYYYLLYCVVPYSYKPPFLKKITKDEEKELDPVLVKAQYVLGWTDREIKTSYHILEQTILKEKDYWKQELGVTSKK